jgi:RNA polymerase sigma-B factor
MLGPTTTVARRRSRDDQMLFERHRRTGDAAARDALVERFLPLAHHLARRYRGGVDHEDLVQVASLGLLKAIDRYDPARGTAFSSFAVPTILGELKRYFRDHGWAVRVPRDLQERSLEVSRASEQLSARLGRAPTAAEVAGALGASTEHVLEALVAAGAHYPDRLDAPADDDPEREQRGPSAEDPGFARAEDAATLGTLLDRLAPRARETVRLRFEEDLTQTEIGVRLGVSQMHVSRTLRRALRTLQELAEEA